MAQMALEQIPADKLDRVDRITVSTRYLGRYQSVSSIRDVPEVFIDEPESMGGANSGPTALESTLAALNACSAMIMFLVRKEMKFDLGGVRFQTDGWVDKRSVEMRRTKQPYSAIPPLTEHYFKVEQNVYITTSETGERLDHFRGEVLRLCPMHALLRDAGVPVESQWTIES
ncbi:OsmC family protein [Phytohabitans sp. ZYX-F-186]|uniref:OsmC family protein n=1 Tax=Phytohabitans maris TaxID=3071409 RepID=A0ABU0ZNS0_9ACTN|nr:OsmC family protein [Phytohabitans sp. ZYX-F-186]MDQ7908019.1 OsmC family protein [Phytohabitans sp. ZYX-F-186]